MNSIAVFSLVMSVVMILAGLIFKKNRIVGYLQLLWIFLLIGLNTGGADYIGNEAIFKLSDLSFTSILNGDLYKVLCGGLKNFGMDYVAVNAIFSLFSVLIINYIAGKHTKNKNLMFSLFMIFPMFDFIIQKRAFLALPFDLLAIEFLFSDRKRKYLYAALLIFVAALIHNSSYFFFLVLFLYYLREKLKDDRKFNKFVIVLIGLAFLALPMIPGYMAQMFGKGRVELYFSEGTISITSALAWAAIHVCFVFLQRFLSKLPNGKLSEKEQRYEKFVSEINMISLILLPLYLYESAFFRLFKVLLVINYIAVANRASNIRDKKVFFTVLAYVVYILFIFALLYIWTGYGFDTLINPLLENNAFSNWFVGGAI